MAMHADFKTLFHPNNHVLLLGGEGFIGRGLQLKLAGKVNLTVLDRSKPQNPINDVTYIQADLAMASEALSEWGRFSHIVHLVSRALPNQFSPEHDIRTDVLDTLALLESLPNNGTLKQCLFLSSGGAIYGNGGGLAIHESQALYPQSSYGIVKGTIEQYINVYAKRKGFLATHLRPGNIYGPGLRGTRQQNAVYVFIRAILKGEPIEVWGDGSAIKDYVFLNDVTEAIALALANPTQGAFNIGTGKAVSVKELIQCIEWVTGKMAQVHYTRALSTDVQRVVLDSTKAANAFGWKPQTELKEGIKAVWDDLQEGFE